MKSWNLSFQANNKPNSHKFCGKHKQMIQEYKYNIGPWRRKFWIYTENPEGWIPLRVAAKWILNNLPVTVRENGKLQVENQRDWPSSVTCSLQF